jgi:hypothetical protein
MSQINLMKKKIIKELQNVSLETLHKFEELFPSKQLKSIILNKEKFHYIYSIREPFPIDKIKYPEPYYVFFYETSDSFWNKFKSLKVFL